MKQQFIIGLFAIVIAAGCSPESKEVQSSESTTGTSFTIDRSHFSDLPNYTISNFQDWVDADSVAQSVLNGFTIYLHQVNDLGQEDFQIKITENEIGVKANSPSGVYYALNEIKRQVLIGGKIKDTDQSPHVGMRCLMIDCGRRYYSIDYLEKLIAQMGELRLNVLHLHFTEWNGFRLNSPKFPGLAEEQSYSREDIKRLQDCAKRHFVDIVGEIDLPAHATAITDYKPEFAFACQSMREARWQGEEANKAGRAWTLDVTRPEVRDWIVEVYEEFIPWFESSYFHVGGDEYQYDDQKELCPELMLAMKNSGYEHPGDVFIEWLNEINTLVKKHGKTTQIWNWWRYGNNSTSLQPDQDIIVNLWNKPRLEEILDEGYKVIITPEEELYISPGLENENGYGKIDKEKLRSWIPETHEQILGYKVCIWSDQAEIQPDSVFEEKSFQEKIIFAQRLWNPSVEVNTGDYYQAMKISME